MHTILNSFKIKGFKKNKVKPTDESNPTDENTIEITRENRSFFASSNNKIISYEIKKVVKEENKVMIKYVGHVAAGRSRRPLPENTIYYEVTIADLMKKLNLKAVKKMLICDFVKNPLKNYVASEWEYDLKNYTSLMLWKGKALATIAEFLSVTFALKYWLSLYEQKDITPQQKEFYKMCTCLVAVGMMDLKPGDNIMANKEGYPVAVDTGFSYFTDPPQNNYKIEEWQECVDILKNHEDIEVNKWGNLIQGYKDHIINIAEQKDKTVMNFANIVEKDGKTRCEVILPETTPLKIKQNKVAPLTGIAK